MEQATALIILGAISTTSGVVVGVLTIFIQFVTERRLRKYDILQGKYLDLRIKEIGSETLDEPEKSRLLANIAQQEGYIKAVQLAMSTRPLALVICGKKISLNSMCYVLFSFIVLIFASSLIYMAIIASCAGLLRAGAIYAFVGFATIAFVLLIPFSYWLATKEYLWP